MIHVDLEQFAATGMLGLFDRNSTRKQIAELLGPAESGGYPDFANLPTTDMHLECFGHRFLVGAYI